MVKPTPTIYSFYAPEVQDVVRNELNALNGVFGPPGKKNIHEILRQNYSPGLDELHFPLLRKYERFARSEGVIGLDTFEHKYFTNGSSEGIFHLIVGLLPAKPLYQFDGEYQGYQAYADAVGRPIITVQSTDELMALPPGILIVSNPSSKHGCAYHSSALKEWGQKHKIILDLAYMGMTQEPLNIDLTDDSIIAVLGSLSKPFGLYYYRIGFCYSKWGVPSLYGNRWFKDALSIKIGEAVLDHFDPTTLQSFKDHYFNLQTIATRKASEFLQWDLVESDVWLLSYGASYLGSMANLTPFKRGTGENFNIRACLTPYYLECTNA